MYEVASETLENGVSVTVYVDEEPSNPRKEYTNAATMVCWHRRYDLGDNQPREHPQEFLRDLQRKRCEIMPIYLYDHSGLSISTSGFSCPWDSGQVGFIYMTPEQGRKEFGRKWREAARRCMRAEVSEYDSYLRGDVYGFVIGTESDDHVDSRWGFIGGYDDCLKEGIAAAQYVVKKEAEKLTVECAAQFAPAQELLEIMAAQNAD
jgi:hypothetical protein